MCDAHDLDLRLYEVGDCAGFSYNTPKLAKNQHVRWKQINRSPFDSHFQTLHDETWEIPSSTAHKNTNASKISAKKVLTIYFTTKKIAKLLLSLPVKFTPQKIELQDTAASTLIRIQGSLDFPHFGMTRGGGLLTPLCIDS